ncbi:hypothetical protein CCM_01567 [Cordyceps militaris CM01]|uniref:Uncharacterized protein n=2 Tax=Cordyceps militaris TaxID=73501 RepID=G3J5V7_CORMM|nr:uncharacterized protein CCM_01567 [Cordyceps militaris CM01]ATY65051.1 hypothetical protein A9K55_004763 [Cordyceps militaris]EGX96909.1 hypothetical protein CCM_01567 [Cordyceps militaris CM01]
MAAKPTLHIAMPPRRLSHYSGPRSPRFHEDFDAPFSEAIMNASLNTVASGAFSPSQERPSLDDSLRRSSPGSSMRTPSFPIQSPTEAWREFPWTQKTQRKSSVNDRVRGWARRSLIFKSRPTSPDEVTERSFSKVDHITEASTTTGVPK